jgi:hypothetical protein
VRATQIYNVCNKASTRNDRVGVRHGYNNLRDVVT